MSGFMQHAGSSVNKRRQEAPHAHSINLDPAGNFAFVADLGIDRVMGYRFDSETGILSPNETPSASVAPGSGPRHFAFHPSAKFAYVINELLLTVTAFHYDATKGALREMQTVSTLGEDERTGGMSTAHIEVHPSGKFLYGSNRGHNTIVVYAIDPENGALTYVENESTQGKTPRNFGITPDGRFLVVANQSSSDVAVFRIDQETGALTFTGQKVDCPNPVCVQFLPIK